MCLGTEFSQRLFFLGERIFSLICFRTRIDVSTSQTTFAARRNKQKKCWQRVAASSKRRQRINTVKHCLAFSNKKATTTEFFSFFLSFIRALLFSPIGVSRTYMCSIRRKTLGFDERLAFALESRRDQKRASTEIKAP